MFNIKMEKLKLACCEINTKSPNTTLECESCECYFETNELLGDHKRAVHGVQVTGKRKLACCGRNARKRQKTWHHKCNYCECVFPEEYRLKDHMRGAHRIVVLTANEQDPNKSRPPMFIQLPLLGREREEEQRRRAEMNLKDDDMVLNYMKTNKLDEYQPEPGYEPDCDYIFCNYYNFTKEQLLAFVKRFKVEDILTGRDNDCFTSEQIIYLLENEGVSIGDVAGFLDNMIWSLDDDEIMSELVAYFLEKDYEIKREWVAKVINDDALIDDIKKKYTFTFDEIYEAREEDSICTIYDKRAWDKFYVQVHKHFEDPEFEDPFADPYIDFKCVLTEHVRDHLQNRYFYNEEKDELYIVLGQDDNRCKFSLGSCNEMLKRNLQDLISEYNEATEAYHIANDKISDLFSERDKELDDASEIEKEGIFDYYRDEIYGDAVPTRNEIANDLSKLYFVIARK